MPLPLAAAFNVEEPGLLFGVPLALVVPMQWTLSRFLVTAQTYETNFAGGKLG